MAIDRTRQTPDGQWVVDQVIDEPGLQFVVWQEGVLAAECATLAELQAYLAAVGVSIADLVESEGDPWCE